MLQHATVHTMNHDYYFDTEPDHPMIERYLIEDASIGDLRHYLEAVTREHGPYAPVWKALIKEVLTLRMLSLVEEAQATYRQQFGRAQNFACALVIFNGAESYLTKVYRSGESRQDPIRMDTQFQDPDMEHSKHDSEESVLADLRMSLQNHYVPDNRWNRQSLEFIFVSNNGACTSCKRRVEWFVDELATFLGQHHAEYSFDLQTGYYYLAEPRDTSRRGTPTTYGNVNDMEIELAKMTRSARFGELHQIHVAAKTMLVD